jgi:hypothetical protein
VSQTILRVPYAAPTMGSDPEIFLTRGGKIVGSERVIPEGGIILNQVNDRGLPLNPLYYDDRLAAWTSSHGAGGSIVRDGVQAELHPTPVSCRAIMGVQFAAMFRVLHQNILRSKEFREQNFQISLLEMVEVDKEELASLTPASRVLGCKPSFNWYDNAADIGVDPETYPMRSLSGHIHLCLNDRYMSERTRLAPLMDAIVGNTCVLVDRDPLNIERRKVYGRAGEFRTPRHGFEYRTLSAFWLQSYPLMSFVFGLSRLAYAVFATTIDGSGAPTRVWDAEGELLGKLKMENVRRAIDENNFDLAMENYAVLREFLAAHISDGSYQDCGINPSLFDNFDYFVLKIKENGLGFWFPQDPVQHWTRFEYRGVPGAEGYLNLVVSSKRAELKEDPSLLKKALDILKGAR